MSVVQFWIECYFFFVVLCCWTVYHVTQQQQNNPNNRVVIAKNTNPYLSSTLSEHQNNTVPRSIQQQQQRQRRLVQEEGKTHSNHHHNHHQQQQQRRVRNYNKRTTSNRRTTTTKTTTISKKQRQLDNNVKCPCGEIDPRPNLVDKVLTARWMVHTLDWGVLTTVSSRSSTPIPFGNVYSFVDGSCTNSTGTPYFYGSYLDQSLKDMKENPIASLTLSEATLTSTCQVQSSDPFVTKACVISQIPTISTSTTTTISSSNNNETKSKYNNFPGDPESPLCARLTLTGKLIELIDRTSDEYQFVFQALMERHPQMIYWPSNHDWIIIKLNITEVWLIDYFGGATILSPEQYYSKTTETTTTLRTEGHF